MGYMYFTPVCNFVENWKWKWKLKWNSQDQRQQTDVLDQGLHYFQ